MMGEARSNLASTMRKLANKVVMRVTRLPIELGCQLDAAVAVREKGNQVILYRKRVLLCPK